MKSMQAASRQALNIWEVFCGSEHGRSCYCTIRTGNVLLRTAMDDEDHYQAGNGRGRLFWNH